MIINRRMAGRIRCACAAIAVLVLGLAPELASAQRIGLRAQRGGEAYVGQAFGVVRLALPDVASADTGTRGYSLSEANGRALYPVFSTGGPLGIIRQRLGDGANASGGPVSVHFLFRGNEPLEITIAGETPRTFRITPQQNPRAHARVLRNWWRHYSAAAAGQIRQSDYPPLIETYLTTVLGRRLQLPDPLLDRLTDLRKPDDGGGNTLSLLLNTESIRLETLEQSLTGASRNRGSADQPLPAEIEWRSAEVSDAVEGVQVETIATRVPSQCFYIRFGSFENYLWLRELMDENGGDIGRMITARGHDPRLNQRLQDQLGLKESALAKILGGQVISDVAMIGRDTYMREGAAFGILFQARNNLLETDLMKQRREAVNREQENGATMSSVKIAGREVSLASTPDNRLRSYYAVDGKFHLVSTSRSVIEEFLATGDGGPSLAETPEFLLARSELPLDREDTIFVYLSPQFFQGLMSPQYQIELRRRLQAVTDLEILQMAQWVARLEGRDDAFAALVSANLVPASIQSRPDGSRPLADGDRYVDSLRGGRGTFTPIPDVQIEGVTQGELATYRQLVDFHVAQWNQMDPLIVTLKRFSLPEPDRERLRVEARMLPFDRQKYGRFASIVGPPSRLELNQPQEDIINVQLVVRGGMLMPDISPHILVFGLQDAAVPLDFGRGSLLSTLMMLRQAPAYLGAWPKLGLLDLLPIGSAPDAGGYSRLPFGLWRRQSPDGFSLLSFDPEVLETTLPQLTTKRSDYLAQARVRVGDISQSQLRPWFEALNYQRAYQTSRANAELLHAVSQQLGVPREQAMDVAESILGVDLICTLGGEYQLQRRADGQERWVSTRWPGQSDEQGPDRPPFTSPLMEWFRGLEADVIMLEDRAIAYAQIDMQRMPKADAASDGTFPLFNLFRDNPFKSQGDLKPAEEDPFEELPPPPPKPIPEPEALPAGQ